MPVTPITTTGIQMCFSRSATLPMSHSGWATYSAENSPSMSVTAARSSAKRNPGMHIPTKPMNVKR